jgi:hypothetical protein
MRSSIRTWRLLHAVLFMSQLELMISFSSLLPVLNDSPNHFLVAGNMRKTPVCGSEGLGFLHQQKSAGMSIRTHMSKVATQHSVHMVGTVARHGACHCPSQQEPAVWIFGDQAPRCTDCPSMSWFTFFREPFDRMRSAYFYCRTGQGQRDSICLDGQGGYTRPCDFAIRWGSYQLVRLANPPSQSIKEKLTRYLPKNGCNATYEELLTPNPGKPCKVAPTRTDLRSCGPDGRGMTSEVYHELDLFRRCGLDNTSTPQGTALLARVKRGLLTGFLTIGLVERWNESMALLANATGCREWTDPSSRAYHASLIRSGEQYYKLETAAADLAWQRCRPQIDAAMDADIQLYAEARRIFDVQLKTFGAYTTL